jgi:hypothetical protein
MGVGARLATAARLGLIGALAFVVCVAITVGAQSLFSSRVSQIAASLVAALVAVVLVGAALPLVDRVVDRLRPGRRSPYAALAAAVGHFRDGAVDEALPGLARVLVDGTDAEQARVWLALEDSVTVAATHPPSTEGGAERVPNAEVLMARSDVDYAVPVLEGSSARAWLTVAKPGAALTPADRRLMSDLAQGAELLLRGVALTSELEQRVRRADELGLELRESQHRLRQARDLERRRLVAELNAVITTRLERLRGDLAELDSELAVDTRTKAGAPSKVKVKAATRRSGEALTRTLDGLDDLLGRFRIIVRGVYPSVLRDQGPRAALDEVATDLPRPVSLDGTLDRRLTREVESGIYYVAAAAMQQLATESTTQPLRVHLTVNDGRLSVLVVDRAPAVGLDELRHALSDETDRLEALGGVLHIEQDQAGATRVWAWLPTDLVPGTQGDPGPDR